MKQVFLSNRDGIIVDSVPPPVVVPGSILVRTAFSVISSGTEATSMAAAGSVARKLARNPALARSAWNLVSSAGLQVTRELISEKMSERIALGYSASGEVLAVGPGVSDLTPGARVACGGAGHAVHAEVLSVPRNLVVPVPDSVPLRDAAFTTIGAVALQGVRQADPKLGETVAVIGLGIVGQLTLQLLRAAGCRTIALDREPVRLSLSAEHADIVLSVDSPDVEGQIRSLTGGVGVDAAIICAASASAGTLALSVCRGRGRIVLVGLAPVTANAVDVIGKELQIVGSRSYGPGRYDLEYELKGRDYPIEYVRWTERRNMASFLQLAAARRLALEKLITHEFDLASATDAYALLKGNDANHVGIILKYAPSLAVEVQSSPREAVPLRASGNPLKAVLVGGGSFMKTVIVPNIRAMPHINTVAVVCGTGTLANEIAKRSRATRSSCDLHGILMETSPDLAIIANRHDGHAAAVRACLMAGAHVLVEKPMTLTAADSFDLVMLARAKNRHLAVGFNRRLAPLASLLRDRVAQRADPIQLLYRINAGRLPAGHWLDDPERGGGRLLGEACHFLDFCCWLFAADPIALSGASTDSSPAAQNFSISLEFNRGSAVIFYTTAGHSGLPKERVEVSAGGVSYVLENFDRLTSFGDKLPSRMPRGDKGHRAELAAFIDLLRDGGAANLATGEDGARATVLALLALRAIRTGIRQTQGWRTADPADIDREIAPFDHEYY